MRCIFVLDIFNGEVVHAVRGERSRYKPIDRFSQVVSRSDPIIVLDEVRPSEAYIADLNRLTNSGDNLRLIAEISLRIKTMADIGISGKYEFEELPERVVPVLGTETASLKLVRTAARARQIVVSVDIKNRKVLTRDPELSIEPLELLRSLNDFPVKGIILLELDKVGTSSGLDKEFLEEAVSVSDNPLILGGGVRGVEDLQLLKELGFDAALVATAVHNRSIPLEMLR